MALPPELADLESRLARRLDEALDDYRRAVELRLREAGERVAAAARELPAPSPGALLGALELSSLDLGSRRDTARETAAEILAALRDLDRATTQAEALDALLDRARASADRVALVLARDGELVGWGERGFDARGFTGRRLEGAAAGRLLAAGGCRRLDAEAAAELLAEAGIGAAGAAVVVPLVLRDRVAALVWADRREGEPSLAALQLLVHAAAQRLELQALSDRGWTPTLYDESEAAGDALPLWSSTAAAEATEPEPAGIEPSTAAPATLPIAELEATPPAEPERWAPEPEPVETFEPGFEPPALASEPAEPAAAAGETAVEELFEPVPPAASEAAPAPGETWSTAVEPLPDFEYAAEPEESARTAAFETVRPPAEPPAAPSAPPADLLGTVRLPLPALAPPPVEERTAPFEVVRGEGAAGAGTHEIPLAPPPVEPDLTEDATLLTGRAQPFAALPVAPAPFAPAPPPPAEPAAPLAGDEDAHDRTSARGGRTTQVAPPPDVQGPGLAFVGARAARTSLDSPAHEEAKRLARLLISEIKLYNEEQVMEGRRNRDLYHRLREDIDRSRQIFEERVDPAVRSETDYFQQELVRSLAGGDPRALGI